MALNISRADVEKLVKKAESAKLSAKRAREKSNETIEQMAQTAEVSMSAFAFGLVNGRWDGVEVLGVPIDLVAGASGHVLGFALDSDHLHNFADGALACYAVTLGSGVGAEMAAKAGNGGAAAGYSRSRLHNMAR